MDDGSTFELSPGQTYTIEPGHDAETVGKEPYVGIEFPQQSAERYAKES